MKSLLKLISLLFSIIYTANLFIEVTGGDKKPDVFNLIGKMEAPGISTVAELKRALLRGHGEIVKTKTKIQNGLETRLKGMVTSDTKLEKITDKMRTILEELGKKLEEEKLWMPKEEHRTLVKSLANFLKGIQNPAFLFHEDMAKLLGNEWKRIEAIIEGLKKEDPLYGPQRSSQIIKNYGMKLPRASVNTIAMNFKECLDLIKEGSERLDEIAKNANMEGKGEYKTVGNP
jgi:hypothetical protein